MFARPRRYIKHRLDYLTSAPKVGKSMPFGDKKTPQVSPYAGNAYYPKTQNAYGFKKYTCSIAVNSYIDSLKQHNRHGVTRPDRM